MLLRGCSRAELAWQGRWVLWGGHDMVGQVWCCGAEVAWWGRHGAVGWVLWDRHGAVGQRWHGGAVEQTWHGGAGEGVQPSSVYKALSSLSFTSLLLSPG